MGNARTVLILSPHFPPSSLAGVHRARHLASGLPAQGWTPVVVSAAPAFYTEPNDPDLARLVAPQVAQVRVPVIPAERTRRFGVGDIGLRGYAAFGRALERAAQDTGAGVVLLTGSPFYPLLLARRMRRAGLKVVLDFQDPWVSKAKAGQPALSKGGLAQRLARLLEPRALAHADAVTSVSEEQNRQMAARHPWLHVPMAAIPIGGDPADFKALRAYPPGQAIHPLDPGKLNVCYVGTFMPRSGAPARHRRAAGAEFRGHLEPAGGQRGRARSPRWRATSASPIWCARRRPACPTFRRWRFWRRQTGCCWWARTKRITPPPRSIPT